MRNDPAEGLLGINAYQHIDNGHRSDVAALFGVDASPHGSKETTPPEAKGSLPVSRQPLAVSEQQIQGQDIPFLAPSTGCW